MITTRDPRLILGMLSGVREVGELPKRIEEVVGMWEKQMTTLSRIPGNLLFSTATTSTVWGIHQLQFRHRAGVVEHLGVDLRGRLELGPLDGVVFGFDGSPTEPPGGGDPLPPPQIIDEDQRTGGGGSIDETIDAIKERKKQSLPPTLDGYKYMGGTASLSVDPASKTINFETDTPGIGAHDDAYSLTVTATGTASTLDGFTDIYVEVSADSGLSVYVYDGNAPVGTVWNLANKTGSTAWGFGDPKSWGVRVELDQPSTYGTFHATIKFTIVSRIAGRVPTAIQFDNGTATCTHSLTVLNPQPITPTGIYAGGQIRGGRVGGVWTDNIWGTITMTKTAPDTYYYSSWPGGYGQFLWEGFATARYYTYAVAAVTVISWTSTEFKAKALCQVDIGPPELYCWVYFSTDASDPLLSSVPWGEPT